MWLLSILELYCILFLFLGFSQNWKFKIVSSLLQQGVIFQDHWGEILMKTFFKIAVFSIWKSYKPSKKIFSSITWCA